METASRGLGKTIEAVGKPPSHKRFRAETASRGYMDWPVVGVPRSAMTAP